MIGVLRVLVLLAQVAQCGCIGHLVATHRTKDNIVRSNTISSNVARNSPVVSGTFIHYRVGVSTGSGDHEFVQYVDQMYPLDDPELVRVKYWKHIDGWVLIIGCILGGVSAVLGPVGAATSDEDAGWATLGIASASVLAMLISLLPTSTTLYERTEPRMTAKKTGKNVKQQSAPSYCSSEYPLCNYLLGQKRSLLNQCVTLYAKGIRSFGIGVQVSRKGYVKDVSIVDMSGSRFEDCVNQIMRQTKFESSGEERELSERIVLPHP